MNTLLGYRVLVRPTGVGWRAVTTDGTICEPLAWWKDRPDLLHTDVEALCALRGRLFEEGYREIGVCALVEHPALGPYLQPFLTDHELVLLLEASRYGASNP